MSNLIKVREVITLKGWQDGSGWSYNQCYSDSIIQVTGTDSMDWDWYETDEDYPMADGEDIEITVDFYAEDADIDDDKPLASYSKWASEIWNERHQVADDE